VWDFPGAVWFQGRFRRMNQIEAYAEGETRIMNRKSLPLSGALLILVWASAAWGEIKVKTEQVNPADPAWKFKTIPGPSKSDVATAASVTLVGNHWESAAGDGSVLVNGRVPNDSLDLFEEALLANDNADGGRIVIDLGRLQPVAAVGSYSWHEWNVDQGSRGPQVYTLYGSAAEKPDPANLAGWTKIADVDTRPNKTGEKWNGQHGAFITDTGGKLGDFRWLLFAVQRTRSPLQRDARLTGTLLAEIDVHTAATLAKAGDATVPPAPPKVTDVWVVFKTHCDLGYTDTVENVLTKFRVQMMDSALRIFDQDRDQPPEKRFSWTIAGWPLTHILGPKQDAARRTRIEQAIREGALAVHALPFTMHTESYDLEDLVRGLRFSSAIARTYGRPLPVGAKMTDVPCHSWVLPTLLANAGVKFLQIGSNDNSGHLRIPPLFWWEGADGSRVLCNYTAVYGSGLRPPRNWPIYLPDRAGRVYPQRTAGPRIAHGMDRLPGGSACRGQWDGGNSVRQRLQLDHGQVAAGIAHGDPPPDADFLDVLQVIRAFHDRFAVLAYGKADDDLVLASHDVEVRHDLFPFCVNQHAAATRRTGNNPDRCAECFFINSFMSLERMGWCHSAQ
jgi:hypothetical protein